MLARADIDERSGRPEDAKRGYARCRDLCVRLSKVEKDERMLERVRRDYAIDLARIATLLGKESPDEARRLMNESHEIRRKFLAAEPERPGYQRDLAVSHVKFAELLLALGQAEEARAHIDEGLRVLAKFADSSLGRRYDAVLERFSKTQAMLDEFSAQLAELESTPTQP
jgi:hypothetical protein